MANLQKNRMDFLAHTPAAGGQNHVPGSQAVGLCPTYHPWFFGCKQHLSLDHKQNVGEQQPAERRDASENYIWKQDRNVVSMQVSTLRVRPHPWSERVPPFSVRG